MIGILGASGYVGEEFASELIAQNVNFREYSRKKHNYYNLESLLDIIHKDNLSILINCAGYTGKPNVDTCEDNKKECYEANYIPETMKGKDSQKKTSLTLVINLKLKEVIIALLRL